MAFCDFVVRYDPKKDSQYDLTKRILFTIIVKRLKNGKPAIVFIGGDSGEGKSYSAIRFQEILAEIQGFDIKKYFSVMNICTPLQYAYKLEKILFDKDYKPVNVVTIHEAREVVKAKMWHSFLSQAVADINAMSRSIKRLCVIIISQFIRDITTDTRYTLRYYMIVRRPLSKKARLYINVLWKDDSDLEKPKLRKRKLSGYLVMPNGKMRRFVPKYLELGKPNKDLIDWFEKEELEAKGSIIRNKLNRLIKQMELDIGSSYKKVDFMVDFYAKDLDKLTLIGKRWRGKFKLKPQVRVMHDLSAEEVRRFEEKLNDRLKSNGVLKDGEAKSE